jgi:hypothetical protein
MLTKTGWIWRILFHWFCYGFSTFNQELNSYKIYNANPYFEETPPVASGAKFNDLTASWIEVVAGLKAKVFDNVFIGFSLRLNRLVSNKKPGILTTFIFLVLTEPMMVILVSV